MPTSSDRIVRSLVAGLAVLALILAMDTLRVFAGEQWLGSWVRIESQYYYGLCALLLPPVFWIYPVNRFLDGLLSLVSLIVLATLFVNAEVALDEAWEFGAPEWVVYISFALWVLVLESLRRAGGTALCIIAGLFSILPIVTEFLPGPLNGLPAGWGDTAAYHALSIESIFGLPFQAFANLVIGFVVFGVVLQHTGGGVFFLNLAFALLGKQRGGPAKVAIVSSGLMGSMSGSVVTNVLTTGQLTIPAMKNAGMAPRIAGGVEACASTGGVLLPPIMGSTAFVMATLLEIPYVEVAIAAAIPALIYFVSLYLQIDAYAGKEDLAGLAEEDVAWFNRHNQGRLVLLGCVCSARFLADFSTARSVSPVLRDRSTSDFESVFPFASA